MIRLCSALLLLCLFTFSLPAAAQRPTRPGGSAGQQTPQGVLSGSVVDADSGSEIASATVAIWAARDSSLVTGTITDDDGRFRIEGMRPGQFYVRVSFVGYATETVSDVALRPGGSMDADLGTIRLRVDTAQLGEVQVTGTRETIEIGIDRTIYHTKDQLTVTGASATQLLEQIPSVEVDIDGNVSLRGSQNVAIQINGKPVPVRGDFLATLLQQIPASSIERVEVIPNPSAKYDPDGMAGILNIVTKQDADLGINGGIQAGYGTRGSYNGSANVTYQKGKVSLFANYGLRHDERVSTGENFRENRFLDPLTYLEQISDGTRDRFSHLFNTTLDYRLGKNTLSASALVSAGSGESEGLNRTTTLDFNKQSLGSYDRQSVENSDEWSMEYGLGFKRVIDPSKHELSAEASFNLSNEDEIEEYTQGHLSSDPVALPPLIETTTLDDRTTQATFQVDYMRPLGENAKLEAGAKSTLRSLDNDFVAETFDYALEDFLIDTGLSNSFIYDEQVHALYSLYGRTLGKFALQGGVRLEQALTDFQLETTGETFDNDYFSVFPSAFVTYSPTEARTFKLSYSKRVNRPRTRMLNPFTSFDDPLNIRVGNPRLKPEYTHAIEASVTQFTNTASLTLTPYYRHTVDAFRRLKTLDEETGISTLTFENFATSDSYGAELIGSFRKGPFSAFASLDAYKVVTDGSNVDTDLSNDALGWSARANATISVGRGLDVQLFYFYRAPMDIERGRISAFSRANFAVRQQFLNNRASLSLRVSDPFDQSGFRFEVDDPLYYQESERSWDSRTAYVTFTYNFGQAQRRNQRRGDREQGDRGGEFEDVGID